MKTKALLFGLLFATPSMAGWWIHTRDTRVLEPLSASATPASLAPVQQEIAKIPVEVATPGRGTQTVYVSLPMQSVPEPGLLPLGLVSSLLLLRRNRRAGK